MPLATVGTNGTTTLHALVAGPYATTSAGAPLHNGHPSTSNIATLLNNILNDLVNGNPIWPGAVFGIGSASGATGSQQMGDGGLLYVPNRGVLKVFAGDWIAYDATGWPILISANAIASGSTSWTHSTV